jgi:anti-anti-sigma regulatory factor
MTVEEHTVEHQPKAPVFLTEREGKPALILQGSVDVFSAEQLLQAALEAAQYGEEITVDCEKVEQVGSAAFQVFLALKDELQEKGK